ncbi:ATP-dependent DNA helicase pif1 [Gigaspora margarita]|uniref:ATP-dependent DNA helicase pif1 n=1 Tax=Gigaspora margarita TaxID=4874 RepID=A0A8H4ER66_GIGMA|nr:ATP-dependent DNA helicase pif1 [Gigaspora margarita]
MNTSTSTGKRRKVLERFLEAIKVHSINPDFVFTDKDFAEINATTSVWGPSIVQLCAWHMNRALKFKLKEKAKLSNSQTQLRITYNVIQATAEFDFIDPIFYPTEDDCDPKIYIICPLECQSTVLMLMQKHFNMHPLISVDAQGTILILTDIRRNAVKIAMGIPLELDLLLWMKAWNTASAKREQNANINAARPIKSKKKQSINEKVNDSYFTNINLWRQTIPPFLILKDNKSNEVSPGTLLVESFVIETTVNNIFYNSTNINEDPDDEARSYVESNWALFEQAIKRISTDKFANNW